ncbi:helix-turn-helix transcriptional regulator [Simiaoa sunii]|uniref:Helix-turn-helix transcriptional regulator n=1 Tax=Simiaoa sunii TaxID=2763672 RepID=A0A7G9G087_9FIRM|nr:helix-turn-helix transcriptional regulator [Simiaoa sunii]
MKEWRGTTFFITCLCLERSERNDKNYVRLKHAQTALLTTNSSITDIALEYGFNDSNYFKDLFKKVYGKSPREYRKNPD